MDEIRRTEIRVGIVSFIALLLFIIGITLGKGCNLTVSTTKVLIRFPSSGAIAPTSPVLVNGVKRGFVSDIKNDNGSVLIAVEIDETADIKADAYARISIQEITGGKKVEIFPGSSAEKFNAKNSVMRGVASADLADMVGMIGDISGSARLVLQRLDSVVAGANSLVNDPKLLESIRRSVSNTDEAFASLNQIINSNKSDLTASLKNLKSLSDDLKRIVQTKEPQIDTLFTKLDGTIGQAQTALTNANGAISNADAMIKDIRKMTDELKSGKSPAGKLLFDAEMGKQLDSTLTTLQKYLKTIAEYGINVNTRLGSRP